MMEPYFVSMRIQTPDLIHQIIKLHTQNLQRENPSFYSDIVEIQSSLMRHSQKLDSIQQMKHDKTLRKNILWELEYKELKKKFPNILGDIKQKASIEKHSQMNDIKSFHLRTLKKNCKQSTKIIDKHKIDNVIKVKKSQNTKQQIQKQNLGINAKKNNDEKTDINYSAKSPYFRKQLAKSHNKTILQNQINAGHVRKQSQQFKSQQNKVKLQMIKFQSPKKMNDNKKQRISLGSANNQSIMRNVNVNQNGDNNDNNNPYHHSKFKKALDNYKLTYDEALSSKRGKVVYIRQAHNKFFK